MEKKINICISTHKSYCKTTLPLLVGSLMDSGVSPEQIFVFSGGYDKISSKKLLNNSTFFEVNYNSFDYNALIGIVEQNIPEENWFLLHDTCRAGKSFYKFLCEKTDFNEDKIALKGAPSMSMGFYTKRFLDRHASFLLSLKSQDYSEAGIKESKALAMGNEDRLLWLHESGCVSYPDQQCTTTDPDDFWYPTSTRRIQEYYPHLDLYKLKANWGQSSVITSI